MSDSPDRDVAPIGRSRRSAKPKGAPLSPAGAAPARTRAVLPGLSGPELARRIRQVRPEM